MAAQSQLFAYHSPLASPLLSTELALLYVSAPQKTCPWKNKVKRPVN